MRKPLIVIIVTLSVVCTLKSLVNTKDQSNACMCEMMSKGSKEALTVLIVTHVTHVERVKRSLNSFTHNVLNIQPIFNLKKVLES